MLTIAKELKREVAVAVYGRSKALSVTVRITADGVYFRPYKSKQREDFMSWKQLFIYAGVDWL